MKFVCFSWIACNAILTLCLLSVPLLRIDLNHAVQTTKQVAYCTPTRVLTCRLLTQITSKPHA